MGAKRLLVDGPTMKRQVVLLKHVYLTRIVMKMTDTPSQQELRKMGADKLIDVRFKMTNHFKHADKIRRRAACTDFEFYKVRRAGSKASKIKANDLKTLRANHPRAMYKMERKRRIDMGVAMGYRKVKKLSPEEKEKKAAREKIIRANRVFKMKIEAGQEREESQASGG